MLIKQISVFIENTTGRLSQFTQVLVDKGINMKAICIADTVDFGILRCLADQPEKVTAFLQENGFTASITEVLVAEIEDQPGALHSILKVLSDAQIGVDYVYSVVKSKDGHAGIVIKVANPVEAIKVLTDAGVKLYSQQDI